MDTKEVVTLVDEARRVAAVNIPGLTHISMLLLSLANELEKEHAAARTRLGIIHNHEVSIAKMTSALDDIWALASKQQTPDDTYIADRIKVARKSKS